MIVTIHQPCFFPYLGIVKKISQADVFVLYDNAQYTKGYVFERNRIKTHSGSHWFKIPLSYHFGDALNEVEINDAVDWRTRFFEALGKNYQEAPYYREYIGGIQEIIRPQYHTLAEINTAVMLHILKLFHITPKVFLSSSIPAEGKSTARLVEICRYAGGTEYLSGPSGRRYLDTSLFAQYGIGVRYADFNSPEYPQLHGGPFLPNLSCIDYLFNCGPDIKILE
jgi:hypothetical protein